MAGANPAFQNTDLIRFISHGIIPVRHLNPLIAYLRVIASVRLLRWVNYNTRKPAKFTRKQKCLINLVFLSGITDSALPLD